MPRATFFNLPEEKKERITGAALEEFAQKGYRKGSMQAIALRAGVAKGSLYQYFANKKELFLYIFRLAVEEKIRFVRGLFEENRALPFFAQLEKLFLESRQHAREHPHTYHLYLKAREEVPAEIREVLTAYLESAGPGKHYASLIQDALDSGEIRGDMDAEFAVFVVHTLLQEFGAYLTTAPGKTTACQDREQAKQFVTFLKKGLG